MAGQISKAKRKKVYARDKMLCRYCGDKTWDNSKMIEIYRAWPRLGYVVEEHPDCITIAGPRNYELDEFWKQQMAHIDHIHPKSKGGGNDMSNLVVACADCNTRKNNRSYKEFVK